MPVTDPMDALRTLQPAIDNGEVRLRPCLHDPGLWILQDEPNGQLRTTYVLMDNGKVQSIAQLVPAEPIDGVPCLSLGSATIENARDKGLATNVATRGIADMRRGLKRAGIRRFYVEAVIAATNEPSRRLAERVLGTKPKEGTDHFSGDPVVQYVKLYVS